MTVPHVLQEVITLPEHHSSLSTFTGLLATHSVFCVVFCRSLFVLLSFLFWLLRYLSFDLRLLIIPLVSSNFSIYRSQNYCIDILYLINSCLKQILWKLFNRIRISARKPSESWCWMMMITYNTMVNRKSTKGQTMIYKTLQKTKYWATGTPIEAESELWWSDARRITLVTNTVTSREWPKDWLLKQGNIS
jgi:hypothetical protein